MSDMNGSSIDSDLFDHNMRNDLILVMENGENRAKINHCKWYMIQGVNILPTFYCESCNDCI